MKKLGTGKTFFALGIVKKFFRKNKDAGVIYFESENAISKDMIESRGVDSNRLLVMPQLQRYKNLEHNQLKL